jgi:TrmH family RNA methyltransferase
MARHTRTVASGSKITSTQNPRFKSARALRGASDRREQKRLLVDGAREISRALQSGVKAVEAWVAVETMRSDAAHAAMVALRAAGAEIIEATPQLLAKLAYGDRDDGIVAVLKQPPSGLAQLDLPETPLIAVVDQVEKPGNLGALLRSADGAGIDAVIATDPVSDIWNPNAIRASLGTIFSLSVATCSAIEALEYLRGLDVSIITARVEAEHEYDAIDLKGGTAIVVGSEQAGLDDAWKGDDITAVSIPMLGVADSLNVSASAAVLFYEARRQRRAAGQNDASTSSTGEIPDGRASADRRGRYPARSRG